ncbi:MAG TPA: hypothetical protein VLB44_03005, partial [Kofleriaceae bacterium]|nr:hypothetical protein [Kofleriaceae bacterium]
PQLSIDYGQAAPSGVGLTATDDVTVLVEAEVELDVAGTWRFQLDANDAGFIEIAPPGGDFTRLVNDVNTGTIATYAVTTPGWYRIRGAFADSAVYMQFDLQYDPPALPAVFVPIPSDRLRASVDDLSGFLVDGFDSENNVLYQGSIVIDSPLDLTTSGTNPYGIGIGTVTWALHTNAQFLIEIEGDYAFTISSHQGHRVWLDGTKVADAYGPTDATTNTPAIHLTPGWHDLVADIEKENSTADSHLSVVVASGPMWAGQPIPADHLRPVLGRAVRWAEIHSTASTVITDGSAITRTLTLTQPVNVRPMILSAGYTFTHPVRSQVGITLTPPVGSAITMVAPGSLTGAGGYDGTTIVPLGDLGATWTLRASDSTVDAMTGSLEMFAVTLVCGGGTAPFPSTYRFESAPKDLGNVVGFGQVRWQARQGTLAKVQVRSCDDAAACASEPWVDVASSASVPALAAKRFAQYAVDFASDGDTPTALDWIELAYSARP